MSLQHSPTGPTSRTVIQTVSRAFRTIEELTSSPEYHDITKEDADSLNTAARHLSTILESRSATEAISRKEIDHG